MTLIKLEDAIEEIESAMKYDESNVLIAGLACAKGIIASLPSAEAEWIPCSERLPSEERYYLCCNKGYLPFIAHYYGGQWHDFYGIISHVEAWQPLPKPYREDDEA